MAAAKGSALNLCRFPREAVVPLPAMLLSAGKSHPTGKCRWAGGDLGAPTQPAWPWSRCSQWGAGGGGDQPPMVPAPLPACLRHRLCPDPSFPKPCNPMPVTNLHQRHPLFCCNEPSMSLFPEEPVLGVQWGAVCIPWSHQAHNKPCGAHAGNLPQAEINPALDSLAGTISLWLTPFPACRAIATGIL